MNKLANVTCHLIFLMVLVGTGSMPVLAATDMLGSSDFDDLPRVERTHIVGYQQSDYDTGIFVTGMSGKEPRTANPEGRRTRIVYLGQEDQTSLQLLRNYQRAFADYGDYTERYSCRDQECYRGLAEGIVWSRANQIKVSFKNSNSLYIPFGNQQSPAYVYGTIAIDDRLLHVSMFTTFKVKGGTTGIRNLPIIHLEILEEAGFKPTLVRIEADEIVRQIGDKGSVALYGIRFELGSAAITAESAAAISEVAKAIAETPGLNVFVVGHTDNSGTLEHNRKLSQQRAQAVVADLVGTHGIAASRLTAVGVGPVAPVASNSSEEGRALNRRVQIVSQ